MLDIKTVTRVAVAILKAPVKLNCFGHILVFTLEPLPTILDDLIVSHVNNSIKLKVMVVSWLIFTQTKFTELAWS